MATAAANKKQQRKAVECDFAPFMDHMSRRIMISEENSSRFVAKKHLRPKLRRGEGDNKDPLVQPLGVSPNAPDGSKETYTLVYSVKNATMRSCDASKREASSKSKRTSFNVKGVGAGVLATLDAVSAATAAFSCSARPGTVYKGYGMKETGDAVESRAHFLFDGNATTKRTLDDVERKLILPDSPAEYTDEQHESFEAALAAGYLGPRDPNLRKPDPAAAEDKQEKYRMAQQPLFKSLVYRPEDGEAMVKMSLMNFDKGAPLKTKSGPNKGQVRSQTVIFMVDPKTGKKTCIDDTVSALAHLEHHPEGVDGKSTVPFTINVHKAHFSVTRWWCNDKGINPLVELEYLEFSKAPSEAGFYKTYAVDDEDDVVEAAAAKAAELTAAEELVKAEADVAEAPPPGPTKRKADDDEDEDEDEDGDGGSSSDEDVAATQKPPPKKKK